MGCTSSSLVGTDDFKDIDATPSQGMNWRSKKKTSDPIESALSQEAYTHATPTMTRDDRGPKDDKEAPKSSPSFGSHTYMGTLPFTGKAREPKMKKKHAVESTSEDIKVPGKPKPLKDENEDEDKVEPVSRTNEDHVQSDPNTDTKKKKPGLYERYTKMKMGPGEARDPVTGRGELTGMTKEEIVDYVSRTRGAGLHSGRQYAFVTAQEGMGGYMG